MHYFLAEVMKEMGIEPESLKLRVGIFGAEPWSENMRKEIEANLKLKAIDIYGLSEVVGPGVSCECEHQVGMHVNEDHFIPKLLILKHWNRLLRAKLVNLFFQPLPKKEFRFFAIVPAI